jgi:GNAT superfamily N-acetyltransferase
MRIEVRRAEARDAETLARIHVAGWRSAYAGIVPDAVLAGLDVDQRTATWRTWLGGGSRRGGVLVAERDGEVAGFVTYGPSRDPGAGPTTGEVGAIYVDPEHLGTGLGAALMKRALAALADAGYADATLWVLEANDLGRTFYAKGGWEPDGATKEEDFGESEPLVEIRLRRRVP